MERTRMDSGYHRAMARTKQLAFVVALALGLAGAACGGPTGPVAPSKPIAPGKPGERAPFVVAIVVDQLSAWVAQSRWAELPERGGFARLRREGTWVKTMRFPYAVTDTAPGHAALHTGKVPAESGIFGNEIPDTAGRRVTFLRDDAVRAVVADGPRDVAGSSPARLKVDTVADRLRAARPDAFVVSVSVKDRGAIMPAGQKPTYAVWYDSMLDSFVTSSAFATKYPSWAIGIGDTPAIVKARSKAWEPSDVAWTKAHAATPDAQAGEGDLDGMGIAFPHVAKTGNAFRGLPASDTLVIDLGLAAIAAEWDPKKPTLLLLSMSASDVIGHAFGPDSWEAWDHLYKLDAELARLFAALDERVGATAYSVLLSADHGNISMPEVDVVRKAWCPPAPPDPFGRPCKAGHRLGPNALRDQLKAAAKEALGEGSWIAGFADPYAYLTDAARALPADKRARLDKAVRATLAKHSDVVSDVIDDKSLAERCPKVLASARGIPDRAAVGEDLIVLVCRSWMPNVGAGDYYVLTHPGSFFDGEIVVGKGTSHGTPYVYDRTVPMLVRAPGRIDAGAVIDAPVDFTAYSALEAAFAGLDTHDPKAILAAATAK